MSSRKKKNIINELESFLQELNDYQYYRLLQANQKATKKQMVYAGNLRDKLLRDASRFRSLITELTGKEKIIITRKGGGESTIDIWFTGLAFRFDLRASEALSYCEDVVTAAIGKLESDINKGIRDKQGNLVKKPQEFGSEPPKAFIVHGGRSGALNKLREFVESLGIKPLIVEMLPTKGMLLPDKVKKYQKEADCAIILATCGGIIDTKSGKQHPRLNVIDELSSFYEAFPEKVIVLLEKGAELPSNKAGLTYEPFTRQSMDRAFIAIARELTEMKILKAVKPQAEEQTS